MIVPDDLGIESDTLSITLYDPVRLLLVGRSKSGKTTIVKNMMNDVVYCKNELYKGTIDPYIKHLMVKCKTPTTPPYPKTYSLTVIDTPGLFEFVADDKDKRNDEALLQIFSKFIADNETTLNCVLLVHDGSKALDDKDIEIWNKVLKYFGDFKEIAFVVTHADLLSDEERKEMSTRFKTEPKLAPILKECGLGLFFSSACIMKYKAHPPIDEINRDRIELVKAIIGTAGPGKRVTAIATVLETMEKGLKEIRENAKNQIKADPGCNII